MKSEQPNAVTCRDCAAYFRRSPVSGRWLLGHDGMDHPLPFEEDAIGAKDHTAFYRRDDKGKLQVACGNEDV
jgi:hypothetical protein